MEAGFLRQPLLRKRSLQSERSDRPTEGDLDLRKLVTGHVPTLRDERTGGAMHYVV
jgi:hypothetical protein